MKNKIKQFGTFMFENADVIFAIIILIVLLVGTAFETLQK